MAEFEDKINSILSNPDMMKTIMSMAGSMGAQNVSSPPPPPQQPQSSVDSLPFDPAAMKGMMELLRGTQLDKRQQELLKALSSWLPQEKVNRLQKAMQASRVARYASAAMGRR